MKLIAIARVAAALFAGTTMLPAQEAPEMPKPTKEHAWLKQFSGEWESEAEVDIPGQGKVKGKGTETARMIGDFWVVGEGKSEMMGMAYSNILTLGYDPEKKKFVGSWIDSMSTYMWKYTGEVDSTGKILTLHTEGPCMMENGKICKFREVTEFKSKDERVFTSYKIGADGKEVAMVTVTSKRKK